MTQTLPASLPLADRMTGHVLLRNISWRTYAALLAEVGDDPTRLTYDHGLLEIEVPSRHHELIKGFVGELVATTLKRAGVDYEPAGSATWQRRDDLRGLEADECYHIQHAARVAGKTTLDLAVDPPPDLAIEVDLTSSSIDKLQIYASLGVPEVWRVRVDGPCEVLLREPGGSYRPAPQSLAVPPVTPELLSRFVLLREQVGHSQALRRYEADVLGGSSGGTGITPP